MPKFLDLVLIPTEVELGLCKDLTDRLSKNNQAAVRLCGWGLVQSGIITTQLILELKPNRVWLVGLAGAFLDHSIRGQSAGTQDTPKNSPELKVGCAYEFSQVAIDGIGAGQGANHLSFEQLGWNQLFGGPPCPGSVIQLNSNTLNSGIESDHQLLSVCSASASSAESDERLLRFPHASAEDMETYAVAAACKQLNVPLRVIRGISNLAGNRNPRQWQAQPAMRSAMELVCTFARN